MPKKKAKKPVQTKKAVPAPKQVDQSQRLVELVRKKFGEALIERRARGLNVFVVLDKSDKTAKNSMLLTLRRGNVDVAIDGRHTIMHDKIVIVDGQWLETGSFRTPTS